MQTYNMRFSNINRFLGGLFVGHPVSLQRAFIFSRRHLVLKLAYCYKQHCDSYCSKTISKPFNNKKSQEAFGKFVIIEKLRCDCGGQTPAASDDRRLYSQAVFSVKN